MNPSGIEPATFRPQLTAPPHIPSRVLCGYICSSGRGSVVGIATTYGLDGPGIESRWGARFSAPVHTGPEAHPASCTLGTGSLSRGQSGQGVDVNHPPHVALRLKKEWCFTCIPPRVFMTRYTVNFTFFTFTFIRPADGGI